MSNSIERDQILKSKLNLVYKNKNKIQPQELFTRKTSEADTLPGYADVQNVIKTVEADVPEDLDQLKENFGLDLDV
ncbi:unnamed protein product [Macrosiphum euphorbiae]|uniref:Uncharacterized protein n=1 Tax=Macrosiphum euphorbiae TaxID=13131 RepID=A0AAV0XSS4_9HEMI|nr:unnamed protein product [Macrosiphum euphorbiae]